MAEIVKGITNLFQSLFQIVYGTVATVVSTIVQTFQAAFSFVVGLIKSVVNVSEGIIGLVVGKSQLLASPDQCHKTKMLTSATQATSR